MGTQTKGATGEPWNTARCFHHHPSLHGHADWRRYQRPPGTPQGVSTIIRRFMGMQTEGATSDPLEHRKVFQ